MKNAVNIMFYGLEHAKDANTLFSDLTHSQMYDSIHYNPGPTESSILITFGVDKLKEKLLWLSNNLSNLKTSSLWEFAGPECRGVATVDHGKTQRFMSHADRAYNMSGERWVCLDVKCRKENGILTMDRKDDGIMTYREFSSMLHSIQSIPDPPEKDTKKLADIASAYGMSRKKLMDVLGISEDDLKKELKTPEGKLDGLKRSVPFNALRPYHFPIQSSASDISGKPSRNLLFVSENVVNKLKAEIEAKDKQIKDLLETIERFSKEFDDWDGAKLLPRNLVRAADHLLRFLAGLNLQDHPISDQKAFLCWFHGLKKELGRVRDEQFGDPEEYATWLKED